MAYQNVSTPRFYIDILSYLKAHGLLSAGEYDTIFFDVSTGWYLDSLKLIGINPTSPIELESQNTPGNQDFLFFTSAIASVISFNAFPVKRFGFAKTSAPI